MMAFLAPRWPHLLCALFAVLVLAAATTGPKESGPSRHAPQKQASGQDELLNLLLNKPPPLAAGAVLLVVGLVVFASYVWLLLSLALRGAVFLPVEFPRAGWNGWDALVAMLVFLVFPGFIAGAVREFGAGGAFAVHGMGRLLSACVILGMIRRRGQNPLDALGLRVRGLSGHMASGLAVFFALLPGIVILTVVWQMVLELLPGEFATSQEVVIYLLRTQSTSVVVQISIAAVLVAPIAEELFFRGFLYGLVRRYLPPVAAIPIVGILFGMLHPPVAAMLPMCVLGALLCYIYEKTARLTVAIAIHVLFNLFQVALMLAAKFL